MGLSGRGEAAGEAPGIRVRLGWLLKHLRKWGVPPVFGLPG
jgi:hypothetical protein